MKTFFQLFLTAALFLSCIGSTNAQNNSEGIINYKIELIGMPKEALSMMEGASAKLSFTKDFSRLDIDMVMVNQAYIVKHSDKSTILLMDIMGSKTAVKMTEKEAKEAKNKGKEAPKYKVEKTKETKEIAGFKCVKAIIKTKGAEPQIVYYTNEINIPNQISDEYKEIDGFPLEYTIDQGGMKMKMLATGFKAEKINSKTFEVLAEYKIMSLEDFKKKMSSFGGGE